MARIASLLLMILLFIGSSFAKKNDPVWLMGKILDSNETRHYAGSVSNASASATSYGNTSYGNASGSETAVYHVYETLVVEGQEYVYFTSERLHWRWSKGAHVSVNAEVKYYVDGRKLHVVDQDGKEHTVEISKTINRDIALPSPHQEQIAAANRTSSQGGIPVSVASTPPGSDVEIDGTFVGSTPSTISVTPGMHTIIIKRKGYVEWSRSINVLSGNINITAELEGVQQKP